MKYEVVYLEPAMVDIREIRAYLSQFYPHTPEKFLVAMKQGIERLCDNPYIYAEYAGNPAYRKMAVLDYLVFYKVFDQEKVVEIHRILYGMRNIKSYLSKNN